MRKRLTGCLSSEWIRPTKTVLVTRASQSGLNSNRRKRVNTRRSAGSRVMARQAATIIASVLV